MHIFSRNANNCKAWCVCINIEPIIQLTSHFLAAPAAEAAPSPSAEDVAHPPPPPQPSTSAASSPPPPHPSTSAASFPPPPQPDSAPPGMYLNTISY